MAPRTLIVSNRLPVTVSLKEGDLQVTRSAGGLATGVKSAHEGGEGLWIGWPGQVAGLDAERQEELNRRLRETRLVPIALSDDEVSRFYEHFSNGTLWPLFHYVLGDTPARVQDFEVYERVNQRFADTVADLYRPGDQIWVHDYQLMRVPALLRSRLPRARIGFFLHIPFPSSEVFRTLPFREKLLEGLLGADLIGFHAASYLRHFASC
ncbi:MAG TPA: trehalose-6-phosphate synthase, partial [Myxococcaceae bacterium]|nr:trehalose-6-phosphate synthase [Myxococcaceae bacterium]